MRGGMEWEKIRTRVLEGDEPLSVFFSPREGDPRTPTLQSLVRAFQGLERVCLNSSLPSGAEESPFWALGRAKTPPRHFYKALPEGLKEGPFLSLIEFLTRPRAAVLSPKTTAILQALKRPVTLKILIGSSCPFCPVMTERVNRFAAIGENVRSWIVDLDLFPEYGKRYGVKAVPATVIEEEAVLTGIVSETELAGWLEKWGEASHVSTLYRQDLLEKRMEQALQRLRSRPPDLPSVASLLRDEAFGVKLGAMALLEQLIESEPHLHSALWDALSPLLQDPLPQVVGDAAYLMGFLNDARKESVFRLLLDHPHEEVVEIARERLEGGA